MKDLTSMNYLDDAIKASKGLMILNFCSLHNIESIRATMLLQDLEKMYPDVEFYNAPVQYMIQAMARYNLNSIPSIVFLTPNKYGAPVPDLKAKLCVEDMTRDNLIGLISEFKDVELH